MIVAMHETAKRIYKIAKDEFGTEGQTDVAKLLLESPQTVSNWEKRGVSKDGALNAAIILRCDALYLYGKTDSPNRLTTGKDKPSSIKTESSDNEVYSYGIKELKKAPPEMAGEVEELLTHYVVLNKKHRRTVSDMVEHLYNSDMAIKKLARNLERPASLTEGTSHGNGTTGKLQK